jgi:hypothetical protein
MKTQDSETNFSAAKRRKMRKTEQRRFEKRLKENEEANHC